MKAIIKTLLFIVTLALLCYCDKDEPNPIVNIPDNNFLDALIDRGVDTNRDGIISSDEAQVITYLDLYLGVDKSDCSLYRSLDVSLS